ncbi:MAG: restriction endonuclease subunit S [Bacteroidota bacterium]|nr:restriction endonuclease subunit S [Bacteroidota bacterium]
MANITDLFDVITAHSKAYSDYTTGKVAFISNGFYNNGVIGYVEPYDNSKVFNQLGICVSAFCEATVQRPPFLPRGNGGSGLTVLIPKKEMDYDELLNYASLINTFIKWRYSYGRMVNKERLKKESIPDLKQINKLYSNKIDSLFPKEKNKIIKTDSIKLKPFSITTLFDLEHGDFHSLNDLDEGNYPTISRIEYNNGIAGYYSKPENAMLYEPLTLTVSTVTGDCFLQLDKYIATDNVVVLTPLRPFEIATLFFVTMMVNKEKWRWMYGRQCYKTKFASTIISLPVTDKGEIDEKTITSIVSSRWGWAFINSYIRKYIK